MELTPFAAHVAAFLLSVSLKTVLIFTVAGLVCLGLRRASAASRHLLWAVTLVSLLCLPVFCVLLPPLAAPVLPAPPQHQAVMADDVPQVQASIASPSRPATTPSTEANFVPVPAASRLSADDNAAANSVSPRVFAQKFNASEGKATPTASTQTLPVPSPSESKPALSAAPKPTSAEWLLAVWLIGMILVLSRTMLGLLGAVRLVRRSVAVASGPLAEAAEEARRKMGLKTLPSLRDGSLIAVPMTFGMIRPIVLLPAGAPDWPGERLQAVMLHELGHIKRRDWVTAMLAEVVCALYWFHPLVWLAARQLRAESEQACDDLVLTCGISPAEYAQHLLEVVRGLTGRRGSMPAVVTMACKQDITARIKTILANSKNRSAATGRGLAAGILAALVIVLPLAAVRPMAAAGSTDKAETKKAQPQTDAIPSPQVITVPGDTRSPKQISDWQRINQWRRTLLASHTSPWKATLPNGTCVYLTSLWALNGANAEKTWTPGGTLLSNYGGGSLPFYKHFRSTFYNVDTVLVFPSDSVRRQTRVAFGSTTAHPSYGTDLVTFNQNGLYFGSRRYINTGFQGVFPPAQQKTSLVVSLSMGPEAVLVGGSPLSGGTRRLATGEAVTLTKASLQANSGLTQVQFSLPSHFVRNESEYKIAAIDKEGLPIRIPGGSQSYPIFHGKSAIVRYAFQASKLPLDRIKEFRLTYRPSQTVVFRNVALHPNVATATASTQSATAAAQSATAAAQSATASQSALLPDGTQVRLVQITPVHAENRMNPYGPAWSPDGSPSQFRGVSPSEGFVNSPIEMLPGRNRFDTYGYARLDMVTTPRRNFDAGHALFVPHGSGHADITVPLATGPYAAVISGPLDRATFVKLSSGEGVKLSKMVVRPPANNPVGKRLGPAAEVDLTLPDRLLQGGDLIGYRLDALGADGKPIRLFGFSGPAVVYHGHGITRVAFDTRTAELARLKVSGFCFDRRAIHPVNFRNVALQPDIASAQSATASPPNSMANMSTATAPKNFDGTTWTQTAGDAGLKLVAVSDKPSNVHRWWRPDGTPFLYNWHEFGLNFEPSHHLYPEAFLKQWPVLIFRTAHKTDTDLVVIDGWHDPRAFRAKSPGPAEFFCIDKGGYMASSTDLLAKTPQSFSVRLRVSAGPWQVQENDILAGTRSGALASWEVSLLSSSQTGVSLHLTKVSSFQQVRLVAFDAQNHEHYPGTMTTSGNGYYQQFTLAVPFSQIKRFALMTRPYFYRDFYGIARQPVPVTQLASPVPLSPVPLPLLLGQGQARSLRHTAATTPIHEYSLVYLWLPDTSHPRRSHWRWVLHQGLGKIPHIDVEVNSLDAPPLTAYIKRLPSGSTIGLGWQFKKSDLVHKPSFTDLQRLCKSRLIGFDVLYLGSR